MVGALSIDASRALGGGAAQLCLIGGQPRIEIGQPLGIDKGFQHAADFVRRGFRLPHAPEEAEFDDLADMRVDHVDELGLIAARRQERA
ncbi:hypothetical protein D3C85_1634350 [compost metagenome]